MVFVGVFFLVIVLRNPFSAIFHRHSEQVHKPPQFSLFLYLATGYVISLGFLCNGVANPIQFSILLRNLIF